MQSIFRDKLIPVALVAALLGGVVGALGVGPTLNGVSAAVGGSERAAQVQTIDTVDVDRVFEIGEEDAAALETAPPERVSAFAPPAARIASAPPPRPAVNAYNTVVYAPARRATANSRRAAGYSESRERSVNRVAYTPQKRSFWSKHRDKLTVAIGTGAGAAVGGLINGKKGALIGGLAGAGGSALYTYKIRNRGPRN